MRSINNVVLLGNLATDVRIQDRGENQVADFLLAVDRNKTESKPDPEADFVPVTCWNGQAKSCAEYLSKGNLVAVEGRIKSRRWEDDEGNKRSAVEVVARSVTFLTPKSESTSAPEADTTAQGADDDIPF